MHQQIRGMAYLAVKEAGVRRCIQLVNSDIALHGSLASALKGSAAKLKRGSMRRFPFIQTLLPVIDVFVCMNR